jgi:hypothetical protein
MACGTGHRPATTAGAFSTGAATKRKKNDSDTSGSMTAAPSSAAFLARPDAIQFSKHVAGDGAVICAHACKFGLERIVSKRRDAPHRSVRRKAWLKIKESGQPGVGLYARRLHDMHASLLRDA